MGRLICWCLIPVGLTVAGCTGPVRTDDKPAHAGKSSPNKRARLERSLAAANLKLDQVRMKSDHAAIASEEAVAGAAVAVELAESKLGQFDAHDAPQRIARAELGLDSTRDRVTEAREELEQLEQMYKAEDFADHTKDIVLERSRRRLARSQVDLELDERDLYTLREHNLPRERRDLAETLADKRRALDKARRDRDAAALQARLDLLQAESELTQLQEDLAEAGAGK